MKKPKKSLGQNFLIDKNIIKKIIDIKQISKKNIVEIGPGNGSLTDEILKRKPNDLILVEKDWMLSKKLKEKYKNDKRVKIYNVDILKINLENILKKKYNCFWKFTL